MSSIPTNVKTALEIDDLAAALNATVQHFSAETGTLHLIKDDGNLHLAAASETMPATVLDTIRVIPVGKGMAGLAAERREPVTACNIQTDESGDVRPGAKETGMEGAIVVPVMKGSKATGALGIANREERTFSDDEVSQLLEIGKAIASHHKS